MKTKFTIIALSLLFSVVNTNAQNTSTDSITLKGIVKFSPISAVNPVFSAIQFAYEQPLNQRLSLQYELGFRPDSKKASSILLNPYYGINSKVEVRKYKSSFKIGKNHFHGIGLNYSQRTNKGITYHYDQETYTDVLVLNNRMNNFGIYYTMGRHWLYDNGLSLELGASIGFRYYTISPMNVPNGVNKDDLYNSNSINIFGFFPTYSINLLRYTFLSGIFKVGYAF